ncbi:MAG: methyltransferase domain-containing protein [Candidatus Aegiribacteria sp.]|nr:methyltransferase domain-containing protein [Candidatus Aegiribacteria sp.]MBD3295466.1 methyltransferase domain-containing protein [Candidatus Fermentibacteria bacterium]
MNFSDLPREKTDCILCGSDSRRLLSVQDSWPVVRCRECGLVYLSERPSECSLEQLYGSDYYEDEGEDAGYRGYVETFRKYRSVFNDIFEKRHRDLSRHAEGNRLLEVGCAHGFLLDYLESRGWEVTGVEVSPLSSGYARSKLDLEVITGNVEEAELEEGSFDVVLLLDVLEHLHRPFDTLGRIGELLKPQGVLVVQCPWELYHWEEVAEALLKGKRPGTIRPDSIPAHLYFFQPETLEAVLRKGGFRIIARQSGNYGRIRRMVDPPDVNRGGMINRFFRRLYYRWGLQKLLYSAARMVHMGSGIIRYARVDR